MFTVWMIMWSILGFFAALVNVTLFIEAVQLRQDSFSFFKFNGPVSGEVGEVIVADSHHPRQMKLDYIAKPDYSFHYGVEDTKTGNSQGHKESRDGDKVTGEYRVLQDDGLVRIVRYTANPETGFQADIEYARLKQQVSKV